MENGSTVSLAPFLRHFLEEAQLVLGFKPALHKFLFANIEVFATV
jgi:hypothetical protein